MQQGTEITSVGAATLGELDAGQEDARGRYLRFAGIVRFLLGAITATCMFYLDHVGLVDLPLIFVAFVCFIGSFASLIHYPLFKRYPQHFHNLILLFLLVDFAGILMIQILLGGPYAMFVLPLYLIGIFFVGVVSRHTDCLILGALVVAITIISRIVDPSLYALASPGDPGGLTLANVYTGAASAFTISITLLAYLLFRVMDRQRGKLSDQGRELAVINTELMRSNRDLEAANRYKSEFLSTISHELR
ncbi:MAG: hypothetical protein KDH09_10875, partial [Chrysiogenetes bacterium]|nr:hypothetical protein [Chrysiogenetes bacterium]